MFNLVGPLGFKRLIYWISTADITGTGFPNRACYSVLAAGVLFSTAVCVCVCVYIYIYIHCITRCGVVVKELRYKPAGRGFDSRWINWNFSVA